MKIDSLLSYEFKRNNQHDNIEAIHYGGTIAVRESQLATVGKWTFAAAQVPGFQFPAQGGAIGSIQMIDPNGNACFIPKGAVITKVYIDVTTAVTSGGAATIALQVQTAGDLKAATSYSSFTVGLLDGIPGNTAASSIKMTADQPLTMVIAGAALTGGTINCIVEYNLSL